MKYKNIILTVVALAVVGLLWSASSFVDKSDIDNLEYKNINPSELKSMLENKDFVLIDVHIPEQAHIPGTDMLIPYNEIVSSQDKLPQDRDSKIVIYCRSGSMSQSVVQDLADLGYTDIYNLEKGLNDWQKNGYEVENKSF